MITIAKVKKNEIGIWFYEKEIRAVYEKGIYLLQSLFGVSKYEVYDKNDFFFNHEKLQELYKSNVLKDHLHFIDLKDDERAVIWKNNRFETILTPGLHAIWKGLHDVKIETFNISHVQFKHEKLQIILNNECIEEKLDIFSVSEGHEGLYFFNGKFVEKLIPGKYAFWKGAGKVKLYHKDLKEQIIEIPGQDIMTADNVTLRLSAIISYKISDSLKTVLNIEDITNTIYRESQLAMRSVIGTKDLDVILKEKDAISGELNSIVGNILRSYGIAIIRLGIRDIILPGEMKDILNKVMEAKKKAEATLICKREETAAMRSQVNTAKMLENNPTLIRLKELEIIETAVKNGKFNFVLGDKTISQGVMNLL